MSLHEDSQAMKQISQWSFADCIFQSFKKEALNNMVLERNCFGQFLGLGWFCNSPCLSETLNILWCLYKAARNATSGCIQWSKHTVRICREIYSCAKGGSSNLVFRKRVHPFSSPLFPSLLIPVFLNSTGIKTLESFFIPVVISCLKLFHPWIWGAKQGNWNDMAWSPMKVWASC